MVILIITFVAILGIVLVPYWVFVVQPEKQVQRDIIKRLKVSRKPAAVRAELIKAAQRLSAVPAVDGALSRSRDLLGPLERLLAQANSRMTVVLFVLVCGLCAAVTAAIVIWVTRIPWLAIPVAAGAGYIPVAVMKYQRKVRIAKFEDQFPESLDLLARALRAGHAFTTGLLMAAEELPAPVGPEFRIIYDQQNYGMPMGDALKTFAERVPLLDAKFFVTAVMTQRESGGNLSEVLDNLASVIRDRFKVKRQIQVVSAHGRITGVVLTAVPPCLGLLLFAMNPENMRLLFTDPLGTKLLAAAIVLQVTGALIIRKLVRIEY
jgi:tight adherence protein B